jgi:hypothetical protein
VSARAAGAALKEGSTISRPSASKKSDDLFSARLLEGRGGQISKQISVRTGSPGSPLVTDLLFVPKNGFRMSALEETADLENSVAEARF